VAEISNNPHHLLRQTFSHFATLSDADWQMLEQHLQLKTIKKHEYFIEKGEVANQVGFELEGMFRQYSS